MVKLHLTYEDSPKDLFDYITEWEYHRIGHIDVEYHSCTFLEFKIDEKYLKKRLGGHEFLLEPKNKFRFRLNPKGEFKANYKLRIRVKSLKNGQFKDITISDEIYLKFGNMELEDENGNVSYLYDEVWDDKFEMKQFMLDFAKEIQYDFNREYSLYNSKSNKEKLKTIINF